MGIIDLLLRPLTTGRATVRYPGGPADSVRNARTPRFQPETCTGDEACASVCPTAAISVGPAPDGRRWKLDYGACIFCGECIRACQAGAITGTGDFELAARARVEVVAEFIITGGPS